MFFTPQGYWIALSSAFHMSCDAAFIIAARAPILTHSAPKPDEEPDPEILTMASEKVLVMLQGALGFQRGFARLAAAMLEGESLPKLLRRAEAMGLAAMRPARRRVRANAKRLAHGVPDDGSHKNAGRP